MILKTAQDSIDGNGCLNHAGNIPKVNVLPVENQTLLVHYLQQLIVYYINVGLQPTVFLSLSKVAACKRYEYER